jgi:hypothetical protein
MQASKQLQYVDSSLRISAKELFQIIVERALCQLVKPCTNKALYKLAINPENAGA